MRRSFHIAAAVAAAIVVAAGAASAQTLDEIIAKNLKAKGGAEMLKATNSVKMTAKLSAPNAQQQMTMLVSAKRPNMVRLEMQVGDRSQVSGFDGTNAWVREGAAPAQTVTGPQAEQVRQQAEFDPVLLDYKEKGHTVELVGNETLDGKPVHHLKLTRKGGQVQHLYLDAQTGLDSKMVTDAEQAGVKMKVETELADYRTVSGRTVPFRLRQFTNGMLAAEITFDNVQFNVPVDDALFQRPAK